MNPAIHYVSAAQLHADALREARRQPLRDVPPRERRERRYGTRLLEALAARRLPAVLSRA